jgi:hypothetical protein
MDAVVVGGLVLGGIALVWGALNVLGGVLIGEMGSGPTIQRGAWWCAIGVALLAAVLATWQLAALKTAAGGGPKGQNGFDAFVKFLDNITTYGIYVGVGVGTLGLLVGFIRYAGGDADGTKWLGYSALGIVGSLLVRAFAA